MAAWDSGNLDLNLGVSASRLVHGARFSAAPTVCTQTSPIARHCIFRDISPHFLLNVS